MDKIINDLDKVEEKKEEKAPSETGKTYFERDLSLIKKKAIEKTLDNFFEIDEETVKKIIEVY